MFRLSVFFLLLFFTCLSQSSSCPDLTARYHCFPGEEFEFVTIESWLENGTDTYLIDGDTFIADRRVYPIKTGSFKGSKVSFCQDQKLMISIQGFLASGAEVKMKVQYFADPSSKDRLMIKKVKTTIEKHQTTSELRTRKCSRASSGLPF